MKKGIEDYRFGNKNNWRRTVWNEIARRVEDKKEAVVLYLAAGQDLDRKVATSKGFRSNNLIAVDSDKGVVKSLRKRGRLAIEGGLSDVLAAWPRSRSIDVVFADYCCGLVAEVYNLTEIALLAGAIKPDGVLLVNMQRGRETGEANRVNKMLTWEGQGLLHRGEKLSLYAIERVAWDAAQGRGYKSSEAIPDDLWDHLARASENHLMPAIASYKSGVVMDSVVVTMPRLKAYKERPTLPSRLDNDPRIRKIRRRISATLAVRTMRENGTLANCPAS